VDESTHSYIFVYGILRKGYSYGLEKQGGEYIGPARVEDAKLYHIGWGVGMRHEPGKLAKGDLFRIPNSLWEHLDAIEGNGVVYTREIVNVKACTSTGIEVIPAWAYFHTYPGMRHSHPVEGEEWIQEGRFAA